MTPRSLSAVPDTPPRALIYIRVSMTGDREELFSPEMQEHADRDYCARRGYHVIGVLTDIDKTGRSWSKRQVENAVRAIEVGDADVIVTWRWSRFTRNLRDYVIQTARIEAAGGRLEAALEEVDPATAAGLLQRDLFAILAQWESRKIGEAWRETKERRNREGLPHSSYKRLGYVQEGRGFVVDPDTAPYVVEMHRRYVAGEGYRQIAEWLNRIGVKQPRSGGPWSPKTTRYTMINGWAAGHLYIRGQYQPGAHEPIIDVKLWVAYLREVERRRTVPPRHVSPVTALSGLVVCSGCGRSMRVKRFHGYDQLPAGTRHGKRRAPTFACESFGCADRCYVSVKLAVDAVLEWLRPLVEDRTVSESVKVADSAARTVAKADRARLVRELAAIETRLTRLTQDLASGLVHTTEYRSARDAFHAERERLKAALATTEAAVVRPAPTRREISRLLDGWDGSDELGRNRALRDLVWKVEITPPATRGRNARSGIRVFGAWERP